MLDRLLSEPDLEIAGISGTSAGALNGAALKAGMIEGGAQGARARLTWLWEEIGARPDMDIPQWMTPFPAFDDFAHAGIFAALHGR